MSRLVFAVEPPFPYAADLAFGDLELPAKDFYQTGEIASAIGDEKSVFIRRILSGKYPDAAHKVGRGHRRYTPEEVLEIARRKERLTRGLPL